jgi:hypothetical protein
MNSATDEILKLNIAERDVLCELLESEHFKLTIEIRHGEDLAIRSGLYQRLSVVDGLIQRCGPLSSSGPALISEASIR